MVDSEKPVFNGFPSFGDFFGRIVSSINDIQSQLRNFTTSVTVNSITFSSITLWILASLASNTRAIVSPFYHLNSTWILFGLLLFGISHYSARKISTSEAAIQICTIFYFLHLIFYLGLIIWPSAVVFEFQAFMSSMGVTTLIFLSILSGALTGDLAQTDSLGDSFFRHHVIPKLKDTENPIYFLKWDSVGKISLLAPENIKINWNSNTQRLVLNKSSLVHFAPVFVRNRHITSAEDHTLALIDDLPLPRQKALRNYRDAIRKGAKRIGDAYMVQILSTTSPHTLSRSSDTIRLLRTRILIEGRTNAYDFSWQIRTVPWRTSYNDSREPLRQALDPEDKQSTEMFEKVEQNLLAHYTPSLEDEAIGREVFFQRTITNFILHLRKELVHDDSQRGELYMRVMQDCLTWVEDLKGTQLEFPTDSHHTITLERWGLIFDAIEQEPSSVFMRIYNWMAAKSTQSDGGRKLSSQLEGHIDEGLARIRSTSSQPPASTESLGFKLSWRTEGSLERKVIIYSVICRWLLFSSFFTDVKGGPQI